MDERNETQDAHPGRQRKAVVRRTKAIMNETGVSWNSAWLQAEEELGPAPDVPRRRITPRSWPYFMLVAAVIIVLYAVFSRVAGFAVLSLIFWEMPSDGLLTVENIVDGLNEFGKGALVIVLLFWLMIPVSLGVIAMELARSTARVAIAWLGVAVWFAISIWFLSALIRYQTFG